MTTLIAISLIIAFFSLMAVGIFLSRKSLGRGCSMSPEDCLCRQKGQNPSECDHTAPEKPTSTGPIKPDTP